MGNSPATTVTPVRTRPVTVKPKLSIVEDVDSPASVAVNIEQLQTTNNVYSRPTSSFEEEKKSATLFDERTGDERVRALLRQVCIKIPLIIGK